MCVYVDRNQYDSTSVLSLQIYLGNQTWKWTILHFWMISPKNGDFPGTRASAISHVTETGPVARAPSSASLGQPLKAAPSSECSSFSAYVISIYIINIYIASDCLRKGLIFCMIHWIYWFWNPCLVSDWRKCGKQLPWRQPLPDSPRSFRCQHASALGLWTRALATVLTPFSHR